MKIKIAIANSRKDLRLKQTEVTLEEFRDRISRTKKTSETVEEFKKMSKTQQADIKDVGGFILGTLKDGRRKKDCVISRSALSLDMDYASKQVIETVEMLFFFRCYFYSTHKHTPEVPRLRLIIPLSREVTPDEYTAVARKVAEEISIEQFDATTYDPVRLMYWPSTSSDGEFVFQEVDGDLLDPDAVLAKYTDWHNTAEWPVARRQQTGVQRKINKQADPLTKDGVVGAFCRAYPITNAIETFLSDVYQPSSIPGRYDYIPADSQAGVVIYEDRFAYSYHATDPACGKLLNAFDVVRLHKFGEQDSKANPDDPPSKQSSFQAMQNFAVQDPQVKRQLAEDRQVGVKSGFSVRGKGNLWAELELDDRGRAKSTLANIATIIDKDDNLKSIVYNEFKGMIDVIGPLPWKQIHPGWSDADVANAKLYLERLYEIKASTDKFKDALLAVVSTKRLYHPVKEYLNGLAWDGTERLDTLLVDYLGAEDTPYVRTVTRKTLCAAVARIYEPGIKFDSMLVLNGPQGVGKSTFYALLGREWFSDSLSIADMRDKTSAEKLQGFWILEIAEMNGIKKVDVETVKSFLSRSDDKFRRSYGIVVESHPRNNIIVGSSNADRGFLRDVTGNRRFWPVNVTGAGSKHPWELTEVYNVPHSVDNLLKKGHPFATLKETLFCGQVG